MQQLNIPVAAPVVKNTPNGRVVIDPFRKKSLKLTPEEWVRQHLCQWLVQGMQVPPGRLQIEGQMAVGRTTKRFDIVVVQPDLKPWMLIEVKAPHITLSQSTFDQIAVYNQQLQAPYLMISNGMRHFFCQYLDGAYTFLKQPPTYDF